MIESDGAFKVDMMEVTSILQIHKMASQNETRKTSETAGIRQGAWTRL